MDHNGSGRLPAMVEPVESGLFDNQDRVGGAVAGGIEGGLENWRISAEDWAPGSR